MVKSIEDNFVDWESWVFGFGYGSGEEYTLNALKTFFATVGRLNLPNAYESGALEKALTPTVAWLLINTLCHADVIDYGTSPRFGWLSREGEALKLFTDSHSLEELYNICVDRPEGYIHCMPDACNCGPRGYQAGAKCPNPFWKGHHD